MTNKTELKELSERQAQRIIEVKNYLISQYTIDEFKELMWRLTYDPEIAMSEMGLEDRMFISYNIQLRNTLIKYFNENLEDSKKVFVRDFDEFPIELVEAFDHDIVPLNILYSAINKTLNKYYYNDREMADKISGLLHHTEATKNFGGIQALGFDKEETNFLNRNSYAIGDFYDDLYKDFSNQEFYKDDEDDEDEYDFQENISEKMGAISDFYSCYYKLLNFGIDPENLLDPNTKKVFDQIL